MRVTFRMRARSSAPPVAACATHHACARVRVRVRARVRVKVRVRVVRV